MEQIVLGIGLTASLFLNGYLAFKFNEERKRLDQLYSMFSCLEDSNGEAHTRIKNFVEQPVQTLENIPEPFVMQNRYPDFITVRNKHNNHVIVRCHPNSPLAEMYKENPDFVIE